jgi:HEAT repeat protein
MIKIFGTFNRPNIETLKRDKDIEGLIEALDYQDDHNVRREAALALGQIGSKKVIKPLISCLKDKHTIKEVAARSLGEIGDPSAVEPLIGLLKDPDWEVRSSAAKGLGKIGDERAVNHLFEALENAKPSERWFIAQALEAITGKPINLDSYNWKSID